MVTTRLIDPADVLWRRVGAGAIDLALVVVSALLAWWAFPGSTGPLGAVAVVLAWMIGVLALWQGVTGMTPGKGLVGVRTVDANGDPPGVGRAAVRSAAWAVDAFPYLVPGLAGYTAAFGSPHHQRLGDRLAGTYVVDKVFQGHPPFAVALDADGRTAPVEHLAAYLPSSNLEALRRNQFPDDPADGVGPASAIEPSAIEPSALPALTRVVASEQTRGVRLSLPPGTAAWDDELGAFTRRDARGDRELAFDEAQRQWVPVTRGRPSPSA